MTENWGFRRETQDPGQVTRVMARPQISKFFTPVVRCPDDDPSLFQFPLRLYVVCGEVRVEVTPCSEGTLMVRTKNYWISHLDVQSIDDVLRSKVGSIGGRWVDPSFVEDESDE